MGFKLIPHTKACWLVLIHKENITLIPDVSEYLA